MIETIHKLQVADYEIDVVRKDIKNLHLSVHPPTGRIRIATPLRINDNAVRMYALTKLSWIKKHIKKHESQSRETRRDYVYRETHYFQGRPFLLNIVPHSGTPFVVLDSHHQLHLHVKKNATREQKEKAMNIWYRSELKKIVPGIINKWEEKMDLKVEAYSIIKMIRRWGTCSIEKRTIRLNLELAKKPVNCLEYVIVHEMVHFLERRHNDNFVAHLDKYLPTWRMRRDELNEAMLGYVDWE
jgi:predicted metal-dependent hydrolase